MKTIYLERSKAFSRMLIKEDSVLKRCIIEENCEEPKLGEIYKGIVKNIVPAVKCAFVDIGKEKNCYLYIKDKKAASYIKTGDEIIVEILNEEVGNKGAKVSSNFTLGGIYCVVGKFRRKINFSRKIEDKTFIKKAQSELEIPEDISVTIRSSAAKTELSNINEEIQSLYSTYKKIINEAEHSIKPKLLYKNDNFFKNIEEETVKNDQCDIIVNKEYDYNHLSDFFKKDNKLKNNINLILHSEKRNMFGYYGLEKDILKLTNRVVNLDCGGYIVIDKTEAMNVIDVNSGGNTSNNSIDKTAYITNIEAAKEIARQIRLRNLNGIILIDFIDINSRKNQQEIIKVLKEGLINDRSNPEVYPFTELNLIQIARKKRERDISQYILENFNNTCMWGSRLKLSYLLFLINNEIELIINEENDNNIYIELNKAYMKDILENPDYFNYIKCKIIDKIYLNFTDINDFYKVKPIIFQSDIKKMKDYKVLNKYVLYKSC